MKIKSLIRIIVIALVLFFNAWSGTFFYSYLPELMVDYGVVSNVDESGMYASMITSGFYAGRLLSSFFWGHLIDRYGRRKGLVLSLSMVSLSTLLFGLARGFYSSLIARTIVGITNGLSIIGKTLSTEISTPELKSWSVSITNTFWALGSTLGPYLGAKCYDSHSISPSLSGAISVSAFGLVLIFLALYHLREMNSSIAKVTNCNISLLINKPNVKHLIFVFSTNTFFSSVITEIIPYWTAASYDRGGLGFDYTQISRIYLGMIVPQICAQLLLYPLLDKIKSSIWILKLGHLIHLLTFTLLPMGHFIRSDVLIIIWIVSWMVLRNIASFINFATLQKLTNDIVQVDMRGRLNAIQIITSSIFQIIGMFMGGWLIAFTMTSEFVFPFNYYFVFIILSLVSLLSLFVINKINLASFDYIQNETVLQ